MTPNTFEMIVAICFDFYLLYWLFEIFSYKGAPGMPWAQVLDIYMWRMIWWCMGAFALLWYIVHG